MGFMRIRCGYCGGKWEVYSRDNWMDDRARTCPHCGERIDYQIWDKQVAPAFCMMEDANNELYKEHLGYHVPLFQVEYQPNAAFACRQKARVKRPPTSDLISGKNRRNDL